MKCDITIENELFKAANKLRGKIPPADYKFYVLPLLFIRYLSIRYEIKQSGGEINETNEVLYVPYECSWKYIVENINDENIARIIDEVMSGLEERHDKLQGVLPKIYSESNIPTEVLRDLIYLFSNEEITINEINNIDFLGRVYEYFISNFASTEGNRGGEFFTPSSVVNLLVEMLEPMEGIVYDPACGTGGMFIQSAKYNRYNKVSFVGQEYNDKTIKLAKMNAILHGINPIIKQGDTLLNDQFKGLKADTIISNPPFNMKDWGAEYLDDNDPRLIGGINPNNANYMWIQHFLYHLSENGNAGFVIANGALTSSTYSDKDIRKRLLDMNLIDCVVQLPDKMFFGTSIPSALIFISKTRMGTSLFSNREGKILFVNASNKGKLVSKKQRVFTKEDINEISKAYQDFKRGKIRNYNELGISAVTSIEDVIRNDYKLMPSLYTGIEKTEYNEELNNKKISELSATLKEQFEKSIKLQCKIIESLVEINETN